MFGIFGLNLLQINQTLNPKPKTLNPKQVGARTGRHKCLEKLLTLMPPEAIYVEDSQVLVNEWY
jgi:hypothetical protein